MHTMEVEDMDALRQTIQRSEYVVDSHAVAEAILNRLWVPAVTSGPEGTDQAPFEASRTRSHWAHLRRSDRSLRDRLTRRR